MSKQRTVAITNVILARSLQPIGTVSGTIGYLPDIVQEVKAKYSFLTAPKDEDLVSDPPKGAEFKHGKLQFRDRTIVIDRLTLFSEGIAVDTASSTDDCDLLLDNLVDWARANLPKAQVRGPRFYLSHLEMRMSGRLETYMTVFRPIGEKISAFLNGYGIAVPRYEATALNLHFDQLGKVSPQPGVFYIDHRQGVPFGENLWFSQAPLKTGDHITLLKELEKV
jgi:hypothetical protein